MNGHDFSSYCNKIFVYISTEGILSTNTSFDENPKRLGHIRHPSDDFVKDISIKKLVKTENMEADEVPEKVFKTNPLLASSSDMSKPQQQIFSSTTSRSERSPNHVDKHSELTNIDASTFRIINNKEPDAKAVVREAFENGKGALLERKLSVSSEDPLNSLDPLWTLKH